MNGRKGHKDRRGSFIDRHYRKLWMLRTFGNGVTARCIHCRVLVTYATIEADRIIPGGSYRHDNVQSSCGLCNKRRSNNPDWRYAPVMLNIAHRTHAVCAVSSV